MNLLWSLYFILKLGLWAGAGLQWAAWGNLAVLATMVLLSPPSALAPRWRHLTRGIGQVLLVPVAVALWYQEMGFPPFTRLLNEMEAIGNFSLAYLWELVGRVVSWPWLVLGLALVPVLQLLNLRLRLLSWVAMAVLGASLLNLLQHQTEGVLSWWRTRHDPTPTPALALREEGLGPETMALGTEAGARLQALREHQLELSEASGLALEAAPSAAVFNRFVRDQAQLRMNFPASPPEGSQPFDLLVLHICSLSWDDLQATGMDRHPLFGQFDVLFRKFNSATSYSGPAAIRLLRASCGQPRHSSLYQPAAEGCLLFGQLARLGFAPQLLMNHDGRFDQFRQQVVRNLGGSPAEWVDFRKIPSSITAFDGSPLANDGALLEAWWSARQNHPQARVALYYNTVSLHDGNRLNSSNQSSLQTYPLRVQRLFDDIDRVIKALSQSNRRVLLVMVPEHGAALHGDTTQIAGLRDTPSPAITQVPVGVRWIDPQRPRNRTAPLVVNQPVSYTALAQLTLNWVQHGADNAYAGDPKAWLANLPSTRAVSENEQAVVMEQGGLYRRQLGNGAWSDLP